MKLRLMGLRCTHLVSTKKPDTRAFFGLQPLKVEDEASSLASKQKAEERGSRSAEYKDDNHLDPEVTDGDNEEKALLGSPEIGSMAEKDFNIVSDAEAIEQWWDCPICVRPQLADERQFNDHLDLCLSRQTIRDAVQRDTARSPPPPLELPIVKRSKGSGEKKRGRSSGLDDPKQKKLCFG